jgi:lipoic acid synthetase
MPCAPDPAKTEPISTPKPAWLRRRLPSGPEYERLRTLLRDHHLTTVCQQALCPNQFECFGRGTATFLLLGERCTRTCRFCAIGHGPLGPPDPDEPQHVAEAVRLLGLRYTVLTSVTRDDLADGGAAHFVAVVRAVRAVAPDTRVELLVPDFQGIAQPLATVLAAAPEVLNHNLETVPRLYAAARPQAIYARSLELLGRVRTIAPDTVSKSGIMVGLGETRAELRALFADLRQAHCDLLTIGQYLQPSRDHLPVSRFLPPEEFAELRDEALALGFRAVAAGPFVRSSYQAETLYPK